MAGQPSISEQASPQSPTSPIPEPDTQSITSTRQYSDNGLSINNDTYYAETKSSGSFQTFYIASQQRKSIGSKPSESSAQNHEHLEMDQPGFWRKWFLEWWGIELLSLGFSALSMVIILIVLAQYDGKGLPQWKLGISINAFISIFAGFTKSALLLPTAQALGQLKWNWFTKSRPMHDFELLDSASRGPWGALLLLGRMKGITLASIGAAIILLSVPLDLFFQQIVQFPTVWIVSGDATLARTIYYNPVPNEYYVQDDTVYSPDPTTDSAVEPLIWSTGNPQQVRSSCPSRRCTFEPFESLGVCSSCIELPDLLKFGVRNVVDNWSADSVANPNLDNLTNTPSVGWYLEAPGQDPILMAGYSYQSNDTLTPKSILRGRIEPMREMFTRQARFPGGTINFHNITNPLADFLIAFNLGILGSSDSGIFNQTPVVHECALYWCVQTIQARLEGGIIAENITATRQLVSSHADDPWDPDTKTFLTNFTLTKPDLQNPKGALLNFGVSNITTRTTIQVSEIFSPSSWTEFNGDTTMAKVNWRGNPFYNRPVANSANPWSSHNDPVAHVAAIAEEMSKAMRNTPQGATDTYDLVIGKAWEEQIRVHIIWAWIVLPAVLMAISFVFLAATMARSSRDDFIGIWKTSALAILFNGFGDDVQRKIGGSSTERLGQAKRTAKDLTVRLEED
ncbi:hypothetical protein BT63DRAFT_475737 [Microthyrium microscopicum]|uniref:Uncharacterized protein n=1 Tax=Microthyrium microscopicum TaxID=703497 RepID=A0A6A6ULS8_9PEZI|nr:hypothetical protein BT63DRAFT_475737 [Microthyrium microscopicum]